MKISILFIAFILLINLLSAQNEKEVFLFHEELNQFHNVRDFCISNNGKEAYFTLQSPNGEISQIASLKKEDNKWIAPELLSFCDEYMYLEPFLSPNGNRLFFVSNRPLENTNNQKKDFDIWYVDRENEKENWSAPKNLGLPVNSDLDEFYPSVSENNNLYFTRDSPNGLGKDDIYFSKWETEKYSSPILLSENINSSGYEFNAFISRKEDFLIFTKYNEEGGYGSGDLYISKKDKDGNWQKSTNLGVTINTKYMEYCPFYDEENQMLYFTSKRQSLESKNFKNIIEFRKYIEGDGNGLSKIYRTSLKIE